jgi:UDP-N-acetylglucosamine 4,6-dehydratase/5-epimerase
MIQDKTIFIFGGTGSLGYKLNERFINENKIYNFSRDECKHWEMKLHFHSHPNMNFVIGNVADKTVIEQSILRIKPNIIIIASAMKHIDQCEINTGESLKTNLLGTQHILDAIERNIHLLINLETVVFVSSDKACNPINNYGFCKALSETLITEKAHYIPNIKFVNVRYGNVLNSRGSIIPLLHKIGSNEENKCLTLTHESMTRFVMTLEESVDLILHAIENGESGDTIIPKLTSMKVKDLIELFSEKYNKPIKVTGLRAGEKILESLINETQSNRVIVHGNFSHIKSVIQYPNCINKITRDYSSQANPLTKEELKEYLVQLQLL